jgi:ABC-type amino acid transport substrate-binding protein
LIALLMLVPLACSTADDEPVADETAAEMDESAAEGADASSAGAESDEAADEEADEAPALGDLGGREILIGTDATYPPFESLDESGEIVGSDPDLMAAICEIANCVPVFKGTAWDGIFAALKAGEFDVLMSAITILPEREENSDAQFTIPYYRIGQVILARADNTSVGGVEDLPAAVVGVQVATTGDTAATDAGVLEENMRRFDAIPLAIQALLNEDVDVVVLDSAPAEKALAGADGDALSIIGEPFTSEDYGILVPNESPEILEAFNLAIVELQDSGRLNEIISAWLAKATDEGSDEATDSDANAKDDSASDG